MPVLPMGRTLLGAARMSNAPVEPPDPPQTLEDAPMTADHEDRSAPPCPEEGLSTRIAWPRP